MTDHGSGRTWKYRYDLTGRMSEAERDDGVRYRTSIDADGNLASFFCSTGASWQTLYTYDKDGRETLLRTFSHRRTTHYDALGRVTEQTWDEGESNQYRILYQYVGEQAGQTPGDTRSALPARIMNGGRAIDYTYDANGNISTIKDVPTGKVRQYFYDGLEQLVRENDEVQGKDVCLYLQPWWKPSVPSQSFF